MNVRVRSIAVSVSVCVCLSARVHQKPNVQNFTKFSVHVTCGRGSVLFWRQCNTLWASGFVDDDTFRKIERIGQNRRRRMFRPVHQVAAPGAKSAVSDCILLLVTSPSVPSCAKYYDRTCTFVCLSAHLSQKPYVHIS